MNCAESRLLLHAEVDQELDVAHRLELERHLQHCAPCAAESQSLRSLQAALRQAPLRYHAPDSLRNEVQRMTRPSGNNARLGLFQSLWLWKSLAFGATAFALAAILVRPGLSERDQLLNEVAASHVRSLMAEHLADVTSSDRHTVKPWFNGKLDFSPDVQDFAQQGFPLVGGRLDYLRGRPVAALIYRHNKHVINVFVWPTLTAQGAGLAMDSRNGYWVLNREAAGLHYCIVSDLSAQELNEFAGLLER